MTAAYTPGTRIDHYAIIRILGQGGMNSVYLTEDVFHQQKVVLKFPNADLIGNVGVYQRVIVLMLVIIAISLSIIVLGILAQLAHHTIR
jgi:hypothetical protein